MATDLGSPSVMLFDSDSERLQSVYVSASRSRRIVLAACCSSATQVIELCAREMPDIVVLDLTMPDSEGLCLIRKLVRGRRASPPRVLAVTADPSSQSAVRALGAGASGLVSRSEPWSLLESAIMRVHRGRLAVSVPVLEDLVRLLLPGDFDLSLLSARELEVLGLAGTGASPVQIAEALYISEGTVRAHLQHLRRKMRVPDRVQLAIIARSSGVACTATQGAP